MGFALSPVKFAIQTSSTFHSISIVADIIGPDANYDASVAVRYRKQGASVWSNALGLFRIDYTWYWSGDSNPYPGNSADRQDNFTGVIMFLTPDTTYEIALTYNDPDLSGVERFQMFTVDTRAIPIKPTGGMTYYVDNSVSPGGDGSSGNPWDSIYTADANVSAGDIVRIRVGSGSYDITDRTAGVLTTSGAANNWIVYEEDPDDPGAVLNGLSIEHGCNYVWINNLIFTYNGAGGTTAQRIARDFWDESAIYVAPPTPSASIDGVIITDCTFNNFRDSIFCLYECARWIVMDNNMNGFWAAGDWTTEDPTGSSGFGVLLGGEGNPGGPDHIVAYNTITQHTKPIAVGGDSANQPGTNCDIYGNWCYDSPGTTISFDGGFWNQKAWGNHLSKSGVSFITMQVQKGAPWYFLYNQCVQSENSNFKWAVQDRLVLINNTFQTGGTDEAQQFTRCFMRNNLFLTEQQFVWSTQDRFPGDNDDNRESQWFTAEATSPKVSDSGWAWMGDVDYDGFDWGTSTNIVFRWNYDAGTAKTDFSGPDPFTGFFAEVGMEQNGIYVDADLIFENKTYSESVNLILKSDAAYGGGGNPAAESGDEVPNLADFYGGSAPDRGCHDRANGPPQYGQRTNELSMALHLRTNDWVHH